MAHWPQSEMAAKRTGAPGSNREDGRDNRADMASGLGCQGAADIDEVVADDAQTPLADAIAFCVRNSTHTNESSADGSTKPNSPTAPSPSFAAAVTFTSNSTTASMAPPLAEFPCCTNWPKTSAWSKPSIDSCTSSNCTCLIPTPITSSTSP